MPKVYIKKNPKLERSTVTKLLRKKYPQFTIKEDTNQSNKFNVKMNEFFNVNVKIRHESDQTYFKIDHQIPLYTLILMITVCFPLQC